MELSRQIPLPFKTGKLENLFITASCNKFAIKYLYSWEESFPEAYTSVLIGEKYSGKTTLANNWIKNKSSSIILDLSNTKKLLSDNIEKFNYLIIEDIEIHKLKEKKLLHVINECYLHKKYLLITSNTNDFKSVFKLPDLLSRLHSFHSIIIEPISKDFAEQMVVKTLADEQIRPGYDIYPLIADKITSYQQLIKVLNFVTTIFKSSSRKISKKHFKSTINLI